MTIGLIVEKCGMTRIFTEDGVSHPVTVLKMKPTTVTQLKMCETDGYSSIQVTTGEKKPNKLNKAELGHFKKAGVKPGLSLCEFRLASDDDVKKFAIGDELKIDSIFSQGQIVDVTGTSKGKGFAGAIKRHNFSMQDATHGNSLAHRAPGSIGQNQTPGRVFKNKKMAGHMGNVKTTVHNQEIVKIDLEKQLIMVKGTVPGAPGGSVIVRPAVKANNKGDK
jgi:large subunit ribosomal protein L3